MTQKSDNEIIARLGEEGRKRELLPSFLEFYQRLLCIQSKVEQRIGVLKIALNSEAIRERIESGLPLITFAELTLDWSLLQDTVAEVIALFADFRDLYGEPPRSLRELSKEAVRAWFESARLPATATADDANEEFLEAIIHATLKPFLVSHAKALLNLVSQEGWRRRYCPICGGRPDFAFLDKERGARWLLCSRCDAEWLFQRLECPYCGTQNQNALAYFTDEDGLYRLYVCQQCHTYIKAIDLRQTESKIFLSLERVLTLDMDRQALEKGYKPGGLNSTI